MTLIDSGSSTPGRYSSLRPLAVTWLACSAVRQPRSTSRPARASMTATAVPHEPAPMTAARRSGGRPPSHSHWSITHGQMRSVTAVASVREGACTCGKVSARPTRTRTLCGRMRQPLRTASVPMMATGTTGAPVSSASRPTPRRGRPSAPGRMRVPSGKIRTASPRARISLRGLDHVRVALAAADREGAEVVQQPAGEAVAEQLLLGDVVERAPRERGDDERVEERAVVRGEDHRAVGDVLAADPRQPEVEVEERLQDAADEPVDEGVDALLPGPGVQRRVLHDEGYPRGCGSLQLSRMALNGTRTLRGALAGVAGIAVWAAQQPLDKRVFGVDYDDVELLGKFVTREPAWLPIGIAMHVFNGAAFGAIYANVAPSLPGPRPARGVLLGLAEHLATWPATLLLERFHPAAGDLPAAVGQPARVRAGDVAPRALRLRARRGRAAPQPARRRPGPDRRRRRRLQRPRLPRAPRRRRRALSRVLITGASGFAGGHLAALCGAEGDDVVDLSRSSGAGRRPARRGARARRRPRRGRRRPSTTWPRGRMSASRGGSRRRTCATTWR